MTASGDARSETPAINPSSGSPNASRSLKILYHHRTRSRDGQYVHIRELNDALEALGHSVTVVEPPGASSLAFRGSPTRADLVRKLLPKLIYELLELTYSIVEYRRLSKVARRLQPDVLYQRSGILMLSGV